MNINDTIDLSNRSLDANDLMKLANSVSNSKNGFYRTIKLGSNKLSDDGASIIASILANDTFIETLDLGFNDIGDKGILFISDSLKKNNHLRVLYLSGNRISNEGFKCLSDALKINNGIRALYLSANLCGLDGALCLANALKENTYMHTLCLNGNHITATGALYLSQTLISNNTITHLNLSDNNIGDEGLSHISIALQYQRQLEILELSFNGITEVGLSSLCSSLRGHKCSKLMLDNNQIKDNGACLLANILGNSSLTTLSIAFNDISTKGISSIVNELLVSEELKLEDNNIYMQWLDLRGNSINHEAASLIAAMLSKNFTLRSLFLDAKTLSETSIMELTVGIVSNYKPALMTFEGFLLGPSLVKTLKFPSHLSTLSNDGVLKYLKEAWTNGEAHNLLLAFENNRSLSISPCSADIDMLSDKLCSGSSWNESAIKMKSLDALSSSDVQFQIESSPSPAQAMQISSSQLNCSPSFEIIRSSAELTKRILSNTLANDNKELSVWLKALNEIMLIPYDATALWELHQYYYSPPTTTSQKDLKRQLNLSTDLYHDHSSDESSSSDDENNSNNHKRRIVQAISVKKKHRKKPLAQTRISYYPRLKHQLEIYKSESNDVKTLNLLRQLRLLEEEYDVEQQGIPIENIILNLC
jgi:Ran GTPase-activating protein (RanGAP) involved in mRNA processing and transport